MNRIRVLIADDHPVFRYGLRALLQAEASTVEVVGEATTGEDAISMAATCMPDVILMDLNMPGLNGIEATNRILASTPKMSILVLTMFEDDESVFAAMRAGARGYLLKGAEGDEAIRAIVSASKGEAIFSPAIANRLFDYFERPRRRLSDNPAPPFPELTDREREILTLIAQGYTNPAIAERLVLSPKTVRNHVSTIFSKLQVAGRSQAIVLAREGGLTKDC
ncbi:response regulator transcription factor [Cohnella sp. REN36]|uniref:response regulator n=1 Tax=Cohnella sp. REN36 TaxID=2887347 RepID=UPI001D13BFDB|nr:response regulator transcription factor [Cohnella sp. REN36]MCC3372148.1 response regulator transcription factor [Cohnella sp. REN36]